MPARRFIKNDPQELAEYLSAIGRGLVAFDGWPAAGKSTLAMEMASRVGGAVVDENYPKISDADFLEKKGQLRIDEMRRDIDAGGTLVFLPIVCARQVLEQLQMSATAAVWVHWAGHCDLDWLGRYFFDLDDPGPNLGKGSRLKAECQSYVDSHHQPKRSADVIYLNAFRERRS